MLVRPNARALALACVLTGCGPDAGADWMLGVFSTHTAGERYDTVTQYHVHKDGSVEHVHVTISGPQPPLDGTWERRGENFAMIPGDNAWKTSSTREHLVERAKGCGPYTVREIRHDGSEGGTYLLFRGEVCTEVLPPCTDEMPDVPCGYGVTVWCDEAPSGCELD